jgi:hypothetical protein
MRINDNVVASTKDWLKSTEGLTITAYDPWSVTAIETEIIEPGDAVNLPAADRARMNQAKTGAYSRPERY